jgi:hypothetical protein
MDTTTSLLIGIIAGAFGMGYLVYGKKQQRYAAWIAGIGLCVYPYMVDDLLTAVVIGIALLAVPFLWKI